MSAPDRSLVFAALHAIDAVFGDTRVPQSQTREWLEEIASHVEISLDALADEVADEPDTP